MATPTPASDIDLSADPADRLVVALDEAVAANGWADALTMVEGSLGDERNDRKAHGMPIERITHAIKAIEIARHLLT